MRRSPLLNDDGLPFFEREQLPMLSILTDSGEYCGRAEIYDYLLDLAIGDKEKDPD